jgi:ribosome assembly protein 1
VAQAIPQLARACCRGVILWRFCLQEHVTGMLAAGGGQSSSSLLACPQEHVRNMCILAHVDHGKTTCADNLVASNGIISRQSAGKIRYMDSRVDEQERQITMKSSAIALQWRRPRGEVSGDVYLVNLIDSPGHVDFASEVSTAARLADGALVVIDVVEGVAAQTRTVLRQAWRDRVRTCLLLNKVDRLIVELELSPMEAYQRLVKILEQVNAVNQMLLSEDIMAKDAEEKEAATTAQAQGTTEGIDLADASLDFDLVAEEAYTYSPERGNVAFGSASHGWAFTIASFAKLIAGKIGAKPENLQRVLWGEWFFNKKTRRAQPVIPLTRRLSRCLWSSCCSKCSPSMMRRTGH